MNPRPSPQRRFLLLFALAAFSSLAAAERVVLADAEAGFSAELIAIDSESVTLGAGAPAGARTLPAGQLMQVDFGAKIEDSDAESAIHLDSGDVFRGTIIGGSRTEIELSSRALGTIAISLLNVREVRFPIPKEVNIERIRPAGVAAEEDVVLLVGGDHAIGTLDGFSRTGLTIDSPAIGGKHTFPFDRLLAVALADLGTSATARAPGRRVLARLTDGSTITATFVAYKDGILEVVRAGGVALSLRRVALAELVFLDGDFTYISDLELAPGSIDCQLPFPSTVSWPSTRDRAVTGGPISIRGQGFAKGIGAHSRSLLVYQLPAGQRRFLATIGIDDSADDPDRYASVIFRVRAGRAGEDPETAKILFESPVLGSRDAPIAMAPIALGESAETLILEVDSAEMDHVLDRAVWGAARLVR